MSVLDSYELDFGLSDTLIEVRCRCGGLPASRSRRWPMSIDRSNQFPRHLWPKLGSLGLAWH